jgi:hypothetical protein
VLTVGVASFTVSPSTARGGQSVRGRVALQYAAPAGGALSTGPDGCFGEPIRRIRRRHPARRTHRAAVIGKVDAGASLAV